MKEKILNRESNFELMRIISMIYIIIFHVMIHGGFIYRSTGHMTYILMFIYSLIIVHVNSFVLLTGYFKYDKKIKLSKVISLNNTTWFYKVLFLVIVLLTGIDLAYPITATDKIRTLLPIDYGIYWYINTYIVLYLISPILNKVINNVNKKQYFNIIIILLFIISVIPTLTGDIAIYTNLGRSVGTFILLYFIGAYIKKYPIEESNCFSNPSNSLIKTIAIFGYLFCALFGFMSYSLSVNISELGSIMKEISKTFEMIYSSYNSPIIILQTVFYFYIFKTIRLKSRIINYISKCTMGIYLIHENIYVRDNLYNYLHLTNCKDGFFSTMGTILIITVCLFLIGLIIESIRQLIFKFFYNRKSSQHIRRKYQTYFKNLGFDINW